MSAVLAVVGCFTSLSGPIKLMHLKHCRLGARLSVCVYLSLEISFWICCVMLWNISLYFSFRSSYIFPKLAGDACRTSFVIWGSHYVPTPTYFYTFVCTPFSIRPVSALTYDVCCYCIFCPYCWRTLGIRITDSSSSPFSTLPYL